MYKGPIRIEVPTAAVGGVFVAKAYRSAGAAPIAEASDADRITAIGDVITALASTIEGDYSLNPLVVVPPNSPEII